MTRPKTDRGLAPEKLYAAAKGLIPDITIIPDVIGAVKHAIKIASPGDAICVSGSLYVVGEVKAALEKGDLTSLT